MESPPPSPTRSGAELLKEPWGGARSTLGHAHINSCMPMCESRMRAPCHAHSPLNISAPLWTKAASPTQGCIRRGGGGRSEGGEGSSLGPPCSYGPPMACAEGGPKLFKLIPLGAEANFWLSASNIGRGGGGS